MKKLVFALFMFVSFNTFAAQMHSLRSGGQYEADLRNVGIPLAGGMTFTANTKK